LGHGENAKDKVIPDDYNISFNIWV
jgi:hypothetical protein